MALHEIEAAAVYLTEADGLTLRCVAAEARAGDPLAVLPDFLALGEGPIGRAALERRAQIVLLATGPGSRAAIVAPMVTGRLVGMICLTVRASRPAGRAELLLAQAFATRLGELVTSPASRVEAQLQTAVERFRASWTASAG
jgi:hypothetical protein